MFKDGKEFKDAICRHSKERRRELEVVKKNEPHKIGVKCITVAKCPWKIFVSYSKKVRCLQVKCFQEEDSCYASFKNKMVNVQAIANHFEETIRVHPKMKLKEIQRRVLLS
ncbi:hypothetical protein J1N35_024664 [Gossypium stocksii]|uniref:Transposase MuDR plant domain-containing protein n=1 Tax=Gossypium stocksii TaxID=47602 RepID=A0A9D3V623_9ROSI|nr:hypothetical protein J1N35_024664 [Gossypium stocksii]